MEARLACGEHERGDRPDHRPGGGQPVAGASAAAVDAGAVSVAAVTPRRWPPTATRARRLTRSGLQPGPELRALEAGDPPPRPIARWLRNRPAPAESQTRLRIRLTSTVRVQPSQSAAWPTARRPRDEPAASREAQGGDGAVL